MKNMVLETLSPELKSFFALGQTEPVLFTFEGKQIGAFIPNNSDEMPHYVWGEAAKQAEKEGYIGKSATKSLFKSFKNA